MKTKGYADGIPIICTEWRRVIVCIVVPAGTQPDGNEGGEDEEDDEEVEEEEEEEEEDVEKEFR
ncbi:hypothetical protein V1477_008869 [Vespula maculifrons]|uniref:Uncharacterized protein n=1 Tax=Vespula maculifrons TaxID=7453 RepID=A0ABD2CEZ0_VESMC